MAKRFKAGAYKTVNGFLYVISNEPLLKPAKVDEVIIVPNAVMDALSPKSYKYIYNDAFIELFRDLNTFEAVKLLVEKLNGGDLEKKSAIEINDWTKYPLSTTGSKIRSYLQSFLPADFSVIFKNGSSIVIKDLVHQTTLGKNGFILF
ncbi:hypothetical protein [Natronoflexus pectinivorans]|uniref:Uncharacterized protein n=1 Tax=Natronoflexus pectinivorans TaxID=682526 RepID=A0A4R2GGS1_9BACT|nr:hypothetical protein [Natronoflexus pectinivorans]TCO06972.1 hypothetical protein EV194_11192 [Natronoflexus pectinivorans]